MVNVEVVTGYKSRTWRKQAEENQDWLQFSICQILHILVAKVFYSLWSLLELRGMIIFQPIRLSSSFCSTALQTLPMFFSLQLRLVQVAHPHVWLDDIFLSIKAHFTGSKKIIFQTKGSLCLGNHFDYLLFASVILS